MPQATPENVAFKDEIDAAIDAMEVLRDAIVEREAPENQSTALIAGIQSVATSTVTMSFGIKDGSEILIALGEHMAAVGRAFAQVAGDNEMVTERQVDDAAQVLGEHTVPQRQIDCEK